jgi:acyl-CoA thioesterase
MSNQSKAKTIVSAMYENDAFSQWLGIEILEVKNGYCKLKMVVRPEMLNGFKIAHGGITYSFADSALAFASNSRGQKAVSIETSISHLKAVYAEDTLIAKVVEKSLQNRIAIYEVTIFNQSYEIVALFRGTVYRKSESWEVS